MSDHEFDAYLALLSGMLRLSQSQRESIAGELRDHMIERMHALVAAGVPQDEATARALEEFGDASRLASGLAAAAALEKRRRIMRWTIGSVMTCGLLLFTALTLFPTGERGPAAQQAQAQETSVPASNNNSSTPVPRQTVVESDPNEIAFAKLQAEVKEGLEFIDTPLNEAMNLIKDDYQIQVMLDRRSLENVAISADTPLTISIRGVPLGVALERILDDLELTYMIKDGIVLITTQEAAECNMSIRIYPVADLLEQAAMSEYNTVNNAASLDELKSLVEKRRALLREADKEQAEATGTAIIALAESLDFRPKNPMEHIISLIQSNVVPESWDDVGGPASIDPFCSTLVISQTTTGHREIENFLTLLRRAVNLPAAVQEGRSIAAQAQPPEPSSVQSIEPPAIEPPKPAMGPNPFSEAPQTDELKVPAKPDSGAGKSEDPFS